MKFAITGHTKGLGMEISKKLEANKFVGFARSNGFDISQPSNRLKIIDSINDCDVFINNAYSGHSQTELLYDVYKAWSDKNKLIVNIGSNTTSGIKSQIWPYAAHKASLEKASEQLSFLPNPCKVMLIKFGFIGTERVLNQFKPTHSIAPDDAAEFVLNQIKWSTKYCVVSSQIQCSF